MSLSISEIKAGLKDGSLIKSGNKIFTKAEWDQIVEAEKQVEYYDLLQLTKKIQL